MNLWLKKLVSNLPAQRKRRSFLVRRLELQLFSQGWAEPLKVPTARLDLYRRPCCRRRSSPFREARKSPPLHGDLQIQGPCSPTCCGSPRGEGDLPAPECTGLARDARRLPLGLGTTRGSSSSSLISWVCMVFSERSGVLPGTLRLSSSGALRTKGIKILATKDTGNTRLRTGKNSVATHPAEVGMAFFFLSREGPVLGTFRRLVGGEAPVLEPPAGVFRMREGGVAPGLAESGTVFSST